MDQIQVIYLWNAYPSSDFTFGCHTTIQPPKWRITDANTYSSILSLHSTLLHWDIPRVLCVGYLIHLYSLCSLTVIIVFDFLKSSGIVYFLLYIRLIYPNWRNLTCFTRVYFNTCWYENGRLYPIESTLTYVGINSLVKEMNKFILNYKLSTLKYKQRYWWLCIRAFGNFSSDFRVNERR